MPVFWPGEFQGLYSPWGHKELDTTEQLSLRCGASESDHIGGFPRLLFLNYVNLVQSF